MHLKLCLSLLVPVFLLSPCGLLLANEHQPDRPKIGLVLAGGGAKGGAHVGVLKKLEEYNIPVDMIAGTSMGSIVGGLYAAGLTPAEIEDELQTLDWDDLFVDKPDRRDLSFRRKSDDKLYLFKAKPGFNDGKLEIPLAFIAGQKFDLELNRLFERVSHIEHFDALPIPFRAVAADLETGQEKVLEKGSLPRAVRASMAVPGAFDPVEIDGQLLVDGGIVNNIPVSVARQMGADIVIVSDLGSDLYTRDEIVSGLEVAGQMVNFLFGLNSQKSLASLQDQDVLISVKLGDIGSGSFERIAETVALGEQASLQRALSLKRYALSDLAYQQYRLARQTDQRAPVIDFIEINNNSNISDEVILTALQIKTGEPLNHQQIKEDISQIYGLDIFQSVRYEIVRQDDKTGLRLLTEEKSWGPGYLQTGLIASTDFEGDMAFRIGLGYTKTQLNALNGEWRNVVHVGDQQLLRTEIFQPLDAQARYFIDGSLSYSSDNSYVYSDQATPLSELQVNRYALELGVGRQFGNWGQLRLGYNRESGDSKVYIGSEPVVNDFNSGEISLSLSDDKIDNLYFPGEGHFGELAWTASRQSLGADVDFDQINMNYQHAFTLDNNSFLLGMAALTTVDDNAPYQSLAKLGGFARLSGYPQDSLTGQHIGLVRGAFMHKLSGSRFFSSYIGTTLEWGNVWQKRADVSPDNTILAGSIFLGSDTPVGPIYLSYGANDNDLDSFYLLIGPPFTF